MSKKITKQELNDTLKNEIESKADSTTVSQIIDVELVNVNKSIDDLETKVTTDIDSKITNINNDLQTKVTKVAGKDLSTNDYSNTDKQALADLIAEVLTARDSYTNLATRLTSIVESIDNIDLSSAVNDAVAQSKVFIDAVDTKVDTHVTQYAADKTLIESRITEIEEIDHINGGTF